MSSEPHVIEPDGVEAFESPAGEPVVVRATGAESGGAYDLLEVTISPGPGITPMHIHHDMDEAMYVLAGEITIKLGNEHHVLTPGSYAMAPRGVPHTYRNSGREPARVLFLNTPGNNWEYLKIAARHGPVEDESDIEALLPILEEYGIEMVGPPISAETDESR